MASVLLGDLDDFIAPGQACINPLFIDDSAKQTGTQAAAASGGKIKQGDAPMQLVLEDDRLGAVDAMDVVRETAEPDLIRVADNKTAKVSLDDCLACSGCVTSAETVLITQQSTDKLKEAISSGRYTTVVASISPQARASLADRFGLSPMETHARLLSFLRREGVHHLIDSSLSADFSLLEAGEEFVRRYRAVAQGATPPAWAVPPPTVAISSTRRFNVELGREEGVSEGSAVAGTGSRPTQSSVRAGDGAAPGKRARAEGIERQRPPGELLVLTSACPGWVCYAEKTAPEALSCMSTVKSPQQIMGVLAKRVFSRAWNLPSPARRDDNLRDRQRDAADVDVSEEEQARRVFHVSIVQCYDKKLEASRKDFRHEDLGDEAEVDLVLAASEVLELIEERAAARAKARDGDVLGGSSVGDGASSRGGGGSVTDSDDAATFFLDQSSDDLKAPICFGIPIGHAAVSADGASLFGGVNGEGPASGSSGGYLEYVFRYAAARLFGIHLEGKTLVYTEGRNADFRETVLEVGGKVALRFAYAYGFRNIQSILAKARRGKCPYHFVEVMACPSGCVNGGGQIKPVKEGPRDIRERVERVVGVLRSCRVPRAPQDNPLVQAVYRDAWGSEPGSNRARQFLHTTYHNVPKLELSNPHMSPW